MPEAKPTHGNVTANIRRPELLDTRPALWKTPKPLVAALCSSPNTLQHFSGGYETEAPAVDPFDRLAIDR